MERGCHDNRPSPNLHRNRNVNSLDRSYLGNLVFGTSKEKETNYKRLGEKPMINDIYFIFGWLFIIVLGLLVITILTWKEKKQ